MPTTSEKLDPGLETELLQLQNLGLRELRALWLKHMGRPIKHLSAELIRRRLAYEMQARVYGGLKPGTRRQLENLYRALKANPDWTPLPFRDVTTGMVLTRVWKGKTHCVNVLDDGFEHQGQQYDSLSEVARLITGTRRSGPAFFGFREPAR